MRRSSILCAAIFAMVVPGAARADEAKFDLICSGSETSNFGGDPAQTKQFSIRVSIDLDQRLYALPYFKAPKKIFDVQPEKIIFERERGSISTQDFSVSRTDGQFLWVNQLIVLSNMRKAERTGVCQRADFTKLPSTLF